MLSFFLSVVVFEADRPIHLRLFRNVRQHPALPPLHFDVWNGYRSSRRERSTSRSDRTSDPR